MGSVSWKDHGDTEIGTYLRSRIHEPLVFSKIGSKELEKPLLISVNRTACQAKKKKTDTLTSAIVECDEKLQDAGYAKVGIVIYKSILFFHLGYLPN
jgi:predicted secreted Zn-dependent protease